VTVMLKLLAALVMAASIAVGTAGANGSAYAPGLAYGWPGVGARDGGARFVAFGMPKSTIVAAVRARDGRVLRSKVLKGFYGVPLVAYDQSAGGLSGNGRSLVLGSYGPLPGDSGTTRFVVLSTKSLAARRLIALDGSWSFDAISPDASTLFLTEHVRAGDNPLYRVRTFDTRAGLLRGAIVDRLEGEEEMGGVPVARASSAEGRWAYTLYARRDDHPFVHALDTVKREAFCIDLSLPLGFDQQWGLRLKLAAATRRLTVWLGGRGKLATIDTRTWKVQS
jgi:hypothetical protein